MQEGLTVRAWRAEDPVEAHVAAIYREFGVSFDADFEDDLADESAPDDIDTAQPEFSDDLAPDYSEETVAIPHPSSTEGAPAAAKPAAKKAAPRKPKARRGRASVPSWDEILFGATRPDDQP